MSDQNRPIVLVSVDGTVISPVDVMESMRGDKKFQKMLKNIDPAFKTTPNLFDNGVQSVFNNMKPQVVILKDKRWI